MNFQNIGVVVLLVGAVGVLIYASTGESYQHPVPKTVTVTVPYKLP
jgi:hypothetical protein